MKIYIQLAPATASVRQVGVMAVLPVAARLELLIRFVNEGSAPLVIGSPETSQELMLWLAAPAPGGESAYMLNPSQIDATGEITAPLPVSVSLAPQQALQRTVELGRYNLDRWFEPGVYEVWIDYLGVQSNRLRFVTEMRADAVPRLVELALAGPDDWIREQAMGMLARIPGAPPTIAPGGDAAERSARQALYAQRARRFLADWARLRLTPEVAAYFESVRAEVTLRR